MFLGDIKFNLRVRVFRSKMADVLAPFQIEIQYLKDALVASQKKSDHYAQLGPFEQQINKSEVIDFRSDNALCRARQTANEYLP